MHVNKLAKDNKTVIIVCPMQDLKAYDTEEGPDVDCVSDKTVETQVKVNMNVQSSSIDNFSVSKIILITFSEVMIAT